MKHFFLWMVALLIGSHLLCAQQPASTDLKTASGKVYKNARVLRAEPDGVTYMFAGGISKIPFPDLPEAVQKQYGYDPQKAQAFANEDDRIQAEAFERNQAALNADRQRDLDRLAGTAKSLAPNGDEGGATAGRAVKLVTSGAGLSKFVKIRASELATSPFTAKGALVEMTGIESIKLKEIDVDQYDLSIYPRDSYETLHATLPGKLARLAENSRTLLVSVSDPEKLVLTIYGNSTTYKGLSSMPTAIWAEPK